MICLKSTAYHCDDLFQNGPKYTYFHNSLNHTSWLDHFFVSDALSASLCNFNILDNGANCSDHCPVSCDMLIDISVQLSAIVQEPHKCQYRDRWDKADLISY